jgi:hypothetical protein
VESPDIQDIGQSLGAGEVGNVDEGVFQQGVSDSFFLNLNPAAIVGATASQPLLAGRKVPFLGLCANLIENEVCAEGFPAPPEPSSAAIHRTFLCRSDCPGAQ